MKYRDDLEAAQHRIRELENQVADMRGANAPTAVAPHPPKVVHRRKVGASPFGCIGAGGGLVVFILAIVLGGTRACVACDSEVTDPALAALNKCAPAREALGDDIGWSMIGCSNYRGRSGGDPLNGGCHSSGSYSMPVSGQKARGTYSFSSSQPPGQANRFNGGTLWAPGGKYISISADGTCTAR